MAAELSQAEEPERARARVSRLASKAFSSRSRRRRALAAGLRAAAPRPTSCRSPTAARERPRCSRSARAVEWRTAEVTDPLGRRVRARWLRAAGRDGGRRGGGGDPARLPSRLDPLAASSRGLGELMLAARATASGPARHASAARRRSTAAPGCWKSSRRAARAGPTRGLCDVRNPLLGERGAARVFGPQKGATPRCVDELERRLAAMERSRPLRGPARRGRGRWPRRGAGGAGRGARVRAPSSCSSWSGFATRARRRPRRHRRRNGRRDDLRGQGAGRGRPRVRGAGVRCVLFGGRLLERPDGVEIDALPSGTERAAEDLVELGRS